MWSMTVVVRDSSMGGRRKLAIWTRMGVTGSDSPTEAASRLHQGPVATTTAGDSIRPRSVPTPVTLRLPRRRMQIKQPTFRHLMDKVDGESRFYKTYYKVSSSKAHGQFIFGTSMTGAAGTRVFELDFYSMGDIDAVLKLLLPLYKDILKNAAHSCSIPKRVLVINVAISAIPKSAWNFTAQPSPPMLVFLPFESLMMPWALPKSLRTTSRKAVPDAISFTTWFRC